MKIALFTCFVLMFACSPADPKKPVVEIQTRLGDIEIELYADKAPVSVSAFLSYIDSGYYRNCSFYRVLNDDNQASYAARSEIIQGGIWKSNSKKAQRLPGIEHETTQKTGILHKNGTVSLARTSPGTANTEFFICMGDQPGFDYGGENNPDKQGYAAFGRVIKGMEIARKIFERPTAEQDLDPPVHIFNIVRQ